MQIDSRSCIEKLSVYEDCLILKILNQRDRFISVKVGSLMGSLTIY